MDNRISYILKTNNDLVFEFKYGELVTVLGRMILSGFQAEMIGPVKIQEVEILELPFTITMDDDVRYSIIEFAKVKKYV